MDEFHHVALLYAGEDEFVARNAPFLREGLAADEPAMVMVAPRKIELLRQALGDEAARVRFVDMTRAGHNPARIIPAWREFAEANTGRRMRGIGEPIWAARPSHELVECQRHELLLNHAFADARGFRLLCPYDTETLPAETIREAERTHPHVRWNGSIAESGAYPGLHACAAPHVDPLPEPVSPVRQIEFGAETIDLVRGAVDRHAAGLSSPRRQDLILAVNELATNSVRHGGGRGRLRLWSEDGRVVCEVRDRGAITDPLAGRKRPLPSEYGGYGLWVANQVCDLVQIRATPHEGVVRVHMARN